MARYLVSEPRLLYGAGSSDPCRGVSGSRQCVVDHTKGVVTGGRFGDRRGLRPARWATVNPQNALRLRSRRFAYFEANRHRTAGPEGKKYGKREIGAKDVADH